MFKEFCMKNVFKFFGIIALVAVIGFSFAACGGDDDDGGNNNGGTGIAPTITTTSLPGGTVGMAYYQTLTATGDTPITWSIASGSLPTGLTLSTATPGVIYAVGSNVTTAGTSTFTVKATNAAGSDTKPLSIVIAQGGNPNPGTGGTFTLTGIPNQYNGKYIRGWSQNLTNPDVNPAALLIGGQSYSTMTGSVVTILISDGSANIPMWTNTNQRYTGNHTVGFVVEIHENATTSNIFGDDLKPKGNAIIHWGFNSISFSNGSATRDWSAGQLFVTD
jgi:hypothetical protein